MTVSVTVTRLDDKYEPSMREIWSARIEECDVSYELRLSDKCSPRSRLRPREVPVDEVPEEVRATVSDKLRSANNEVNMP